MYGKHYESMYEGSMYGAGVAVFAVMGYVISHTRESRIELNPRKLADTLGGTLEDIEGALAYLTGPDPRSRHKAYEGARLVKEGEFQYLVPSWESYQAIKNEEDRRQYNREAKRRERAKKALKKGKALPGEVAAVAAMGRGDEASADRITTASLPAEVERRLAPPEGNGEVPHGTLGPPSQELTGAPGGVGFVDDPVLTPEEEELKRLEEKEGLA
jgi:hypothetical protein